MLAIGSGSADAALHLNLDFLASIVFNNNHSRSLPTLCDSGFSKIYHHDNFNVCKKCKKLSAVGTLKPSHRKSVLYATVLVCPPHLIFYILSIIQKIIPEYLAQAYNRGTHAERFFHSLCMHVLIYHDHNT